MKDISPLALAIKGNHIQIVKILMEDTSYDALAMIQGETAIHIACKMGEMQVLESLLRKVNSQLNGDAAKITAFLTQRADSGVSNGGQTTNDRGLTALDYCMLKNRHDMAVILQQKLVTKDNAASFQIQQEAACGVVSIESYELEEEYDTDCRNVTQTEAYAKLAALNAQVQYQRVSEAESSFENLPSIDQTELVWVDHES